MFLINQTWGNCSLLWGDVGRGVEKAVSRVYCRRVKDKLAGRSREQTNVHTLKLIVIEQLEGHFKHFQLLFQLTSGEIKFREEIKPSANSLSTASHYYSKAKSTLEMSIRE